MTPPSDLASIIWHLQELEAKATERPWSVHESGRDCWASDDYVFDPQGGARAKKRARNNELAAELRNAAPLLLACASAFIEAREALARIEDMRCIQHMPSCSDIAINALHRIDALLLPFTKE